MRYYLLLLISFCGYSQEVFKPLEQRKEIQPLKIERVLKADGHLDEAEWVKAPAVNVDFQVEPFQGRKASFSSTVKLLYNRQFLYVAAILQDSIGKNSYRAPNLKRDYAFEENDLFGIAIDGFNDKRNALVLQSNAYGAQRDLLSFDDRAFDIDWDGLYRVRTHRSDSSWVAEFAIPWQTLRYPKTDGNKPQDWGINFFRVRRSSNELSVWSPHPRSMSPLRMDYAGKLTGIIPPPPTATNIRFIPYLLQVSKNSEGTEIGNSTASDFKMGGEIKWAISPTSVMDFTFNTDFAQADVDRQVNNISRFSVFFPERRQFFLENASLFSAGLAPVNEVVGGSMYIQPFFSRTIGLDQNVNPIAITAGTRFVYRSEKRNLGGIYMRQGEGDGDPFTNFLVARYSENFGKQNRVGAIVTTKSSPSNVATTGAVDAFIRFNDKFSFSGMGTMTQDSRNSQQGFAEYGQFLYKDNLVTLYWTHTVVSDDYNPEMGFVSRKNVLSNSQGVDFNVRGKWLPTFIRFWQPGIYTEVYHSLKTGNIVEQKLVSGPLWFNLQNGGILGGYIDASVQNLEEDFNPVGIRIKPGSYRYFRKGFLLASDPSAKYSASTEYGWGGFFDGSLQNVDAKFRVAPIPHLNVGLSWNWSKFEDVGVARETKEVNLLILETRMAINPRLQLIGFYQKNTTDNLNSVNMRLAWEYQPLSYVYLVFNTLNYQGVDATQQKQQSFLAKLSFLKQF
ncbi:MAG: carbohydrate binding family 9 domain-containing protein [Aquirufa antheringensis]|nr:carbohydrate binding family 9 domain-containing protein [Aquirufa antheringensis]